MPLDRASKVMYKSKFLASYDQPLD